MKLIIPATFLVAVFSLISMQGCSPLLVAGTVVGAGAVVGLDRRTTGALVEDQAIEIKTTDAIYRDPVLGKQVHIKVTSFNNDVLLTGEAPTAALRDRAVAIVRKTESVKGVLDEIRIAAPVDLGTRSRDTWLTAKVKTSLVVNGAQPNHTKVVTSDGTVYLMGVLSDAEAKRATEVASNVGGVAKVVKLFEYVDTNTAVAQVPADKRPGPARPVAEPEDAAVPIPYASPGPMFSEE